MATLHLQNVPDDLYEKLQQLAASHNRSIDAQVITLLESALPTETTPPQDNTPNKSVQELLAKIEQRRRFRPADFGLPDSTAMIREDRDR
jgi:plasmid stability protein